MVDIVYEDNSIIVIRKPAGMATQSANVVQKDCVSLLKEYFGIKGLSKGREPYVGIVHRLDQPVEGLLVFAKDNKSAAALSKQIQSENMGKIYHALVEGIFDLDAEDVGKQKELECMMYKDGRENKSIVIAQEEADKLPANIKVQKASLFYSIEAVYRKEGMSLLKIQLVTGRFHQIRAQFSAIGHPIIGDRKYGAGKLYEKNPITGKEPPRGAIALIADELSFIHPKTGKKMSFYIK